ncbi:MAG TPA: hypothetical protein VH165_16825 [Kofleriaceae bacterium]|jgi:hypothetical protein|nr:hypothetical protein [Kofleriaceae bacterium]
MKQLMKQLVMVVACAGAASAATAVADPAPKPADQANSWPRYAVEGIALGASLDKLVGFTCSDKAAVVTCVRFVDARCKGKPTQVQPTVAELPPGAGCGFILTGEDPRTYLDHQVQAVSLSAVIVYGTAKRRVFEVRHTFAREDLTEKSRLGKTLIARYGKPSSSVPPVRMLWTEGSTTTSAACDDEGGCSVMVTDLDLMLADEH